MKKITIILSIFLLIAIISGCSSNDANEKSNKTVADSSNTETTYEHLAECAFKPDSNWEKTTYTTQLDYKNGGDSHILLEDLGKSDEPSKQDAEQYKQKCINRGDNVEFTENSEWSNENITGWVLKSNRKTGDNKEFKETVIFITGEKSSYKISYIDYSDDTITENDWNEFSKTLTFIQ